jgi:hypothetical protein
VLTSIGTIVGSRLLGHGRATANDPLPALLPDDPPF